MQKKFNMNQKYKIVAICGKAGAGKDTIFQKVLDLLPQAHEIISCTTRPPREKEVEGINYYFLTPQQFADKVLHNEMLEATCFNDWFYGTSYDSLRMNKLNIGVFNPAGIRALTQDPHVDAKIIYIQASDKNRLLRQLNRESDPDVSEIIRRYKADEEDFLDLELDFYCDIYMNNTVKSIDIIANSIVEQLKASGFLEGTN